MLMLVPWKILMAQAEFTSSADLPFIEIFQCSHCLTEQKMLTPYMRFPRRSFIPCDLFSDRFEKSSDTALMKTIFMVFIGKKSKPNAGLFFYYPNFEEFANFNYQKKNIHKNLSYANLIQNIRNKCLDLDFSILDSSTKLNTHSAVKAGKFLIRGDNIEFTFNAYGEPFKITATSPLKWSKDYYEVSHRFQMQQIEYSPNKGNLTSAKEFEFQFDKLFSKESEFIFSRISPYTILDSTSLLRIYFDSTTLSPQNPYHFELKKDSSYTRHAEEPIQDTFKKSFHIRNLIYIMKDTFQIDTKDSSHNHPRLSSLFNNVENFIDTGIYKPTLAGHEIIFRNLAEGLLQDSKSFFDSLPVFLANQNDTAYCLLELYDKAVKRKSNNIFEKYKLLFEDSSEIEGSDYYFLMTIDSIFPYLRTFKETYPQFKRWVTENIESNIDIDGWLKSMNATSNSFNKLKYLRKKIKIMDDIIAGKIKSYENINKQLNSFKNKINYSYLAFKDRMKNKYLVLNKCMDSFELNSILDNTFKYNFHIFQNLTIGKFYSFYFEWNKSIENNFSIGNDNALYKFLISKLSDKNSYCYKQEMANYIFTRILMNEHYLESQLNLDFYKKISTQFDQYYK